MRILSGLREIFSRPSPSEPPEEGEFVDLNLAIVEAQRNANGTLGVTVRDSIGDISVGFAVEIDSHWDERPVEEANATFYWGTGRLRRSGSESDSFVRLLGHLYGMPCPNATMASVVEAQVVGLANDPAGALRTPIRMKFFVNSESETDYAEIFVNLDVPAKLLEFHEKDFEYRAPLIRSISSAS